MIIKMPRVSIMKILVFNLVFSALCPVVIYGDNYHNKTTDLPPCQFDGNRIMQNDKACVYIPSSSDEKRQKDNVSPGGHRATYNITNTKSEDISNSGPRGGGGDVSGIDNKTPDVHDNPYDRNGKYWLVPPFLIGATSVIVVYVIIHCLYVHCYSKHKLDQIRSERAAAPAIIFSDRDHPSSSSVLAYTPVVKYDGSYGKTEMMEPCWLYQSNESYEGTSTDSSDQRASRRNNIHLQIP